eukprot:741858-Amphidinium_carterae.1
MMLRCFSSRLRRTFEDTMSGIIHTPPQLSNHCSRSFSLHPCTDSPCRHRQFYSGRQPSWS